MPDPRQSIPDTPRILAVGLNPAFQRTLVLDALEIGMVNRATQEIQTAGGKAVHFALAANTLAPKSTTAAFISGGTAGEFVCHALRSKDCPFITTVLPDETRTCTTLLAGSGAATEVVSPSSPIPPDAVADMKAKLLDAVSEFDALAFCGTYPPGVTEAFLIDLARAHGGEPILLDAYKGVDAMLESGLVNVLKINLEEAKRLTRENEPKSIADAVFSRFGLSGLLITDGAHPALASDGTNAWSLELPVIDVVNPIGAGDTCSGVTTLELSRGQSLVDAFASGLAAACASCLTITGGSFDPATMQELRQQIRISRA